ncbi:Leucine-, isoleucine-, valine-, threonine-, and alanine-binding protein [Marinobacterium lacunae]|uniref:Leucine-, isoleucine-, valine-, threonine-, and alanine-binding protein n=1 Tax=Marinobacterium lacunae TaxID=1232683 RepID=A0A081G0Z4_9GAMM|nr:ABC transporter substrate-binding protein [Marinobacterium lacunae]KEA64449.1 Leucine-, isoleucine-, valine-, threonine-, and alanine-binding protein [Marinobacterium lacunae]
MKSLKHVVTVSALMASCLLAAAAQAEDIKIGALLETSGPLASLGQPTLEGAQLAVDEVNAAGGINGDKVVLVNINSESDNTRTVMGLRRLLSQEKVIALIGPSSSGSNYSIVDAVEHAKVPMIANGASIGIVAPLDKRRYTFMAPLTDVAVQSVMLAEMQKQGIKRIGILNSDVAFGTSGYDGLAGQVADYGIEIVGHETFSQTDTDMTTQLTKLRADEVDAIVLWATGPALAIATRNHRALGIESPLYLTHAANDFNYLKLAGEAANGIRLPSSSLYVADSLPNSDPQKPVIQAFLNAYDSKYGHTPATFAGNGYDSAHLLMEAISKAGTDPAAIRDMLENQTQYTGVTAQYRYSPSNHYGAQVGSVRMVTVNDGQFELTE